MLGRLPPIVNSFPTIPTLSPCSALPTLFPSFPRQLRARYAALRHKYQLYKEAAKLTIDTAQMELAKHQHAASKIPLSFSEHIHL